LQQFQQARQLDLDLYFGLVEFLQRKPTRKGTLVGWDQLVVEFINHPYGQPKARPYTRVEGLNSKAVVGVHSSLYALRRRFLHENAPPSIFRLSALTFSQESVRR
jgi:hypothetical protein